MLFKIGVIPGDGVGPEVIAEGLAILGDVAQLEGFDYTLERFDLGGGRYLATGEVLPAGVIEKL
ncbi:MAG: isocitrate/isopropylmalate family dehydrogenase, partial [Isosphaeraceae bacterium]